MSVPVLCKAEEIIVDTTDYNSDEAIESEEHLGITLEDSGGEYQTYHTSEQQTTASTIGATTTITTNNSSPPRNRNNNNNNNSMMSAQTVARLIVASSGKSGTKNMMENEKRMRREIANSNERRRMQSINAGFQSLRSLLPHHEGEKLSKAAILQQTAQYIIELEREKTHLLSQNSQLKRLVGQHEVGGGGGGGGTDTTTAAATTTTNIAIKKRKFVDNVITVQTISDSSDEGLGSMSPEPVTLLATQANGPTKATTTAVATAYLNVNSKELNDLKSRLESERSRRTLLEERLRQLERQIYPPNQYIHREVIEHTDNLRDEDIQMSFAPLQVVELESVPNVGPTQLIVCHSLDDATMTADEEEVISGDLITNVREEVVIEEDSAREYVELSPHLHPILDAAIKAEPKVEVERINPGLTNVKTEDQNVNDNGKQGSGRPRITSFVQQNTSRQNLETIVEAIRHLEGDHLFSEHGSGEIKKSTSPTTITVTAQQQKQELPLALTSKPTTVTVAQPQQQRKLPIELAPYLQLKKHSGNNGGNNTVTIVSSVANATLIAANNSTNSISNSSAINSTSNNNIGTSSCNVVTLKTLDATTTTLPHQIRIKGITSVKQPTRPGVIVTKNP